MIRIKEYKTWAHNPAGQRFCRGAPDRIGPNDGHRARPGGVAGTVTTASAVRQGVGV